MQTGCPRQERVYGMLLSSGPRHVGVHMSVPGVLKNTASSNLFPECSGCYGNRFVIDAIGLEDIPSLCKMAS